MSSSSSFVVLLVAGAAYMVGAEDIDIWLLFEIKCPNPEEVLWKPVPPEYKGFDAALFKSTAGGGGGNEAVGLELAVFV